MPAAMAAPMPAVPAPMAAPVTPMTPMPVPAHLLNTRMIEIVLRRERILRFVGRIQRRQGLRRKRRSFGNLRSRCQYRRTRCKTKRDLQEMPSLHIVTFHILVLHVTLP